MSPLRPRTFAGIGGFPRVSGDEPRIITLQHGNQMFSPRERG